MLMMLINFSTQMADADAYSTSRWLMLNADADMNFQTLV